jgi:hypothetical protein
VLRALNAFFTGHTDIGVPITYSCDYYRNELRSKKRKKNISISVSFVLPASFNFRSELLPVERLVKDNFVLTKTWEQNQTNAKYFLNNSDSELTLEDRNKIDQFLALVNFRYIPNRVLPLDVIRNEHKALRDTLIRRLARKLKGQQELFESISKTAAGLTTELQSSLQSACPDIGGIKLNTPRSWQDFVFAFGYLLSVNGIEIEDSMQGSGIQSMLMFETLSLIDRDYFQKFGWKQAAIWAVEEPESSLHTSLESQVASYLSRIAQDQKGRLQVLCTTHSDLILQNADHAVFVKMGKTGSSFEISKKKDVLLESAKLGISRYSHPILTNPLSPIVLVEGKYDSDYLSQAFAILQPSKKVFVSNLALLTEEAASGGDDALGKFLRFNKNVIKLRIKEAPIIVMIDWDSKAKLTNYKKICEDGDPYHVIEWPPEAFNPSLNHLFKGLERSMSDRIIAKANKEANVIGITATDDMTFSPEDYNKRLKPAINKVVNEGLILDDLLYVKHLINKVIALIQ